jgi:hypothetical protein
VESIGEQGYQKILSIAVAMVELSVKSGGYFALCSYQLAQYWELSATTA